MSIKADPTEFADKRVLVSGGTKGLGRATVERFLAGVWVQVPGFNSLSDDYAYTNARECAFDLVKTLAKEKSLLVT